MASSSMLRRKNGELGMYQSDSSKAQLFLCIACLWPWCIVLLFAISAHRNVVTVNDSNVQHHPQQLLRSSDTRAAIIPVGNKFLNVKNILDRVDILGYSPTHPRVAVVITHSNDDNRRDDHDEDLKTSVKSVFQYTDLNRVFAVCVMVDGRPYNSVLVKELRQIDKGTTPHWHGLRPDLHSSEDGDEAGDDPHGRKVHVVFNSIKRGVAESRREAVEFIDILQKHHETSGLKNPEEDLILLLMESGSSLVSTKWLPAVTSALIVPPPIIAEHEYTVALKMANAVSFNIEGLGKRTSFDTTFKETITTPTADEITDSNGDSYPTPAFNGAAMAMRLDTYRSLPNQDLSLTEAWPANLDLALNIWLCGDGIDMLSNVQVKSTKSQAVASLSPHLVARFVVAWMDDITAQRFFKSYVRVFNQLTFYEWEKLMSQNRETATFSRDLAKRCRSFAWLAERINPELADIFLQSVDAPDSIATKIANPMSKILQNAIDVKDSKGDVHLINLADRKSLNTKEGDISIPSRLNDKVKPSKPLCKECLDIIQRAQPISTTYLDVSEGHKFHPHLGGAFVNGTLGYIHDETSLRQNPPAFHWDAKDLRKACLIRDNNYKMLHEKVFVDLNASTTMEKSGKPRDTIFCLVYTIDSGHSKIPAIRETWGQKCDGFLVASNKTDASIGAVNIPHEGEENYDNIWQKVRSMWSYVYDNYYEKYDWFHIGGDDLFLIVENLRLYLESEEIKTAGNGGIYLPDGTETTQFPLFLGRRFAYMGDMNDIFNSGGSGYTLNKAALKALAALGIPKFFSHAHTFSEDTMVAHVFRNFGVFPYETKDEFGGERYMPFLPGHHYGYRLPADKASDWYAKYSINIKEGLDHCASRSVAFHYVKGDMMKRLHALLYGLCPADTLK